MQAGLWEIGSRDDVYGWKRGDNFHDSYRWDDGLKTVLFMHWDPTTPTPFTAWTHASVLLAPDPTNPWGSVAEPGRDLAAPHSWNGFKRHHYRERSPTLLAGVPVTSRYHLRLGTQESAFLPDINGVSVANAVADDYRAPASWVAHEGLMGSFEPGDGVYPVVALEGRVDVVLTGGLIRHQPVFSLTGYDSDELPEIHVEGVSMPRVHVRDLRDGRILVHVLESLPDGSRVRMGPPGSVWD